MVDEEDAFSADVDVLPPVGSVRPFDFEIFSRLEERFSISVVLSNSSTMLLVTLQLLAMPLLSCSL